MGNDNWHTLRVPPEAYETAREQKEEHGRTWGEQVVRPDDGGGDAAPERAEIDTDALARDVAAALDYAALAEQVADDVTRRLQR